jgi:hypothetical protein
LDPYGMLAILLDHNPVDLLFSSHHQLACTAAVVMSVWAIWAFAQGSSNRSRMLLAAGSLAPMAAMLGFDGLSGTPVVLWPAVVIAVLAVAHSLSSGHDDPQIPRRRTTICTALISYACLMAAFACELSDAPQLAAQAILYYLAVIFASAAAVLFISCLPAWAKKVNAREVNDNSTPVLFRTP